MDSNCNFTALIDLIKNAMNVHEIKKCINTCVKNNITTFSNYYVIVNFYIYITDIGFCDECFNAEIILEFLFIECSSKKTSTSNKIKNNLLCFVNTFHEKNNCSVLKVNLPKYTYYKPQLSTSYMLNIDEVKKIFKTLESIKLKNRKEDILMINILLNTGIRVTEMLNIEKKYIVYESDIICITIKGKNNFYRIISISPNYESLMKEVSKNNEKWLFESNSEQFKRQYVYYLVKKILTKSNIYKFKNGPHIFRHTFASRLYEKHKDIVLVQEALGHKNIATTIKYMHIHKETLILMTKVYE